MPAPPLQWTVHYGHPDHRKVNITGQIWRDMRRRIPEENCQLVVLATDDYCRSCLFGDPCVGVLKSLWITTEDNRSWQIHSWEDATLWLSSDGTFLEKVEKQTWTELDHKLQTLREGLTLDHGGGSWAWKEELAEQYMALRFVRGHEQVLELGGNIGRNSLLLARLLKTPHLVMETCPEIAHQLQGNRDDNKMQFDIVVAALSKRRLVQQEWQTRVLGVDEEVPAGHFPVDTITWEQLEKRRETSRRPWDTLVADCEGALLPVLQDFPELLDSMQMLLLENDYHDLAHKQQVDDLFLRHGFRCTFRQTGGWGPCYDRFYEVWLKACD